MDILEFEKKRMKLKKRNPHKTNEKNDNFKVYVNRLITRLLLSIILFFTLIIISNFSLKTNKFIKNNVLNNNIAFSKLSNFYKKYFGNIVPFEDLIQNEQTVFNEQFTYKNIKNYKDGYEVQVENNYLIPVISSGIVVFIGEKEGLGETIIIQGIDEIDYWYSNVTNISLSLYDYVTKGTLLGSIEGNKMYLTFKRGSEFLEYNEIFK